MLGLTPLGILPLTIVPSPTAGAQPTDYHFSDRGWVSKPTDSPANQYWEARLTGPLSLERSLPLSPTAARRVALQLGDIGINNADGAYDNLVRRTAIDGRSIEVKVGQATDDLANFRTLFAGTANSWRRAGTDALELSLRDAAWLLDVPAQTRFYGGAGGLDGGPELKNQPKPMCYGYAFNISPVLVDAANLIYQFHDGPAAAAGAVRDRAAPIAYAGDVADITVAAPGAGNYVTQLSGGYIRLGAPPAGLVTADVRGALINGVPLRTASDIAYRLMRERGLGLPDSKIDPLSLSLLLVRQPASVGFYVGLETPTVADLLDLTMGSIGGWWGPRFDDVIEVGLIEAPGSSYSAALDTRHILDVEMGEPPESINPPWWRATVGYQRNWTIQDSDLAGSVSAADRAIYANPYRYSVAKSELTQLKFLRAQDAPAVGGLFEFEADAVNEANRLLALYSELRYLATVRLKVQGYMLRLGRTLNLTAPRFGLDAGRNVMVVGHGIEAASNESSIQVWF